MTRTIESASGSASKPLISFVREARDKGIGYETIWHMLSSAGWKEAEVGEAISEQELHCPIPKSEGKGGAREAFYYLTQFTALYVATVSLILLVFGLLDLAIPDPTESSWRYESSKSAVRSALSFFIVFCPLVVLFRFLIRKETSHGRMIAGGVVERWLTYLTLFVVIMTVLIDSAVLIYMFLDGSMTSRVVLKGLVLIGVLSTAFVWLRRGMQQWSHKPAETPQTGSN